MVKSMLGVGGDVPKDTELAEIKEYGGKYWAGNNGHIYAYSESNVTSKRPNPFLVAESMGSKGYLFVAIISKGVKKTMSIHTLICAAWHGAKPTKTMCTRHLDGNRENNHPENLCWGTYSENEADKRRHGRTAMGEKQGSAKLTEEAVIIIRASIPRGLWNTRDAAIVFGVDPSTIRRIARGQGWEHVDITSEAAK